VTDVPPSSAVLDSARVRRAFERAAAGYGKHDVLQRAVREEILERLEWIRFEPEALLDLGSGPGDLARALRVRYPRALNVALDWSWGMLAEGRRRGGDVRFLGADAGALPFPPASFDIVVSTLLLQWIDDLPRVLAEVRRVLRPRGAFLFATLGPDTLIELRRLFARVDEDEHVLPFRDMHVVGDLLVQAGFSEPVLDVGRFEILYPDLRALIGGLRGLGATNHRRDRARRPPGGRGYWARLEEAAEAERRPEGGIPATFEVIYGLAWAPVVRWRESDV